MPAQVDKGGKNLNRSARDKVMASYLDVRYTAERRPYTQYPSQLCRYLVKKYLVGGSYQRLLDLGCGRGDFLHGFAECGFKAQGLDVCTQSTRPFPEPIIVAEINGQTFPVGSDSFDVVFSKSVIEHIKQTDIFLSETLRILRPGGLFIVMTPDWSAQYKHFYDDYTHVRPFTKIGLEDVLESHGFLIEDSRRFRQLPFVWRWPFLHLLCDVLALLPDRLKSSKTVKFSKEWMLLVVAKKPHLEGDQK